MTISPVVHTPSPAIENPPSSKWKEIGIKVWEVIKKILLAIANAGLFLLNPTLYAIGFCAGFVATLIWPGQIQTVIDKIKLVFKHYAWILVPLTIVAGFLSLQVTLAVVSVLSAAHLGGMLGQAAHELWLKEEAKKSQVPSST